MTEQQTFMVKAFFEKPVNDQLAVKVINKPVATLADAWKMFDTYYAEPSCQAVYIYRGITILASWDRHANYLMAIGDIQPEDELLYHRFLYEPEVQP